MNTRSDRAFMGTVDKQTFTLKMEGHFKLNKIYN